ncbi:Crp/Fnr family transcriptional regulator [Rhodoblastus sp.]|uniref:Crp/Fnr family transcriptional regulator n=1 Tax=Rhodoblastus sp. TaxID=1962975 RepID=UPI003F9E0DBB
MSEKSAVSEPLRLQGLEIFQNVAAEVMEQVSRRAQRRTLQKGELLFNVGDPSDALYVIASGRIRIWTVSAAGVEVTLNVQIAGAIFGEIGMLDGSVRTAGASAMATTELISISRKAFFDALDRDSQLAHNVIGLLCQRLRWTTARMEDAVLRPAPQRLARILGHLVQDHSRRTPRGHEITIKLTQGELAQWTAMSRESLNKLLNRWIDEGVVFQEKGVLTICKSDVLEDLAESDE